MNKRRGHLQKKTNQREKYSHGNGWNKEENKMNIRILKYG